MSEIKITTPIHLKAKRIIEEIEAKEKLLSKISGTKFPRFEIHSPYGDNNIERLFQCETRPDCTSEYADFFRDMLVYMRIDIAEKIQDLQQQLKTCLAS